MGKSVPNIQTKGLSTYLCNVEALIPVTILATGLPTTFTSLCAPFAIQSWLNGIAVNFSKWRWVKLRYIYFPVVSTANDGSFHMGLQYDTLDTSPTTVAQMSALSKYTTGPIWNGYQAAPALSSCRSPIPVGAMVVEVDVNRFSKPWYPYITQTGYTAQTATFPSLGDIFVPAKLIMMSSDGNAALTVGRVYVQYEIELIEPEPAAMNV